MDNETWDSWGRIQGGPIRQISGAKPSIFPHISPRIPPQDSQVSLSTPGLFHTLDIYTLPCRGLTGSLRKSKDQEAQGRIKTLGGRSASCCKVPWFSWSSFWLVSQVSDNPSHYLILGLCKDADDPKNDDTHSLARTDHWRF